MYQLVKSIILTVLIIIPITSSENLFSLNNTLEIALLLGSVIVLFSLFTDRATFSRRGKLINKSKL